MGQIPAALTIQEEVCVCASEFVDGDTSVVAVISVRHVEKRQPRQRSGAHNLYAVEAVKDPQRQRQKTHHELTNNHQ